MKSLFIATVLAAGSIGLLNGGPGMATGTGWTYSGSTGPQHWAAEGYPICAESAQSPIDLENAYLSQGRISKPRIHDANGHSEVVNNGHSIESETPAGTTIKLAEVTYELVQIHYHRPSEHTVNGVHYPIEVHFVAQAADGRKAVFAVFLTSGKATNKAWQPYIAAARRLTGGGPTVEAEIDYSKLLPSAVAGYRYDGSLTTPPCTQGVSWNVAAHPVRISKSQMATLQAVTFTQAPEGPNNRPVQALNGRSIISNILMTNGSD